MKRLKIIIHNLFINTGWKTKSGHTLGMLSTCGYGMFISFLLYFQTKKGRRTFQLIGNATHHLAVFFRFSLTYMASFKRKLVVGKSKSFSCIGSAFGVVNPLCSDSLAPMSNFTAAMNNQLGDSTIVDVPQFAEVPITSMLNDVPQMHGITDIHSFNGFHSFYDFLRQTLFHTRYVLVKDKYTVKSDTKVYNLSVNKDESYVTPIGIAHNCRCTVVQVRKGKYEASDEHQAMEDGNQATAGKHQEMMRFNPGKQAACFPAYNPYTVSKCGTCSKGNIALAADIPSNELCAACPLIRQQAKFISHPTQNGALRVHQEHGSNEKEENIKIASYFTDKYGQEIDLLPRSNTEKCADAYNRTLKQLQEYKQNNTPTVNSIDSALRDANRKSDHVILLVTSDISEKNLTDAIRGRMARAKRLQSVTIIKDGKDAVYTKKEILKGSFKINWVDLK